MSRITIILEDDAYGNCRIKTDPDFRALQKVAKSHTVTSAEAYALMCITNIARRSLTMKDNAFPIVKGLIQ